MKFYSELLEKFYDQPEALLEAEVAYQKKLKEDKAAETSLTARKKELATAVDKADAELDAAYRELDDAKVRCKAILDESNKMMNEILDPATKKVKDAQRARVDAIRAFNKEFGVFRTSYTGDKAVKEFERTSRLIDELFSHSFINW